MQHKQYKISLFLPPFWKQSQNSPIQEISHLTGLLHEWQTDKFCPSLLVPASHLLANSCKVFLSAPSWRMLALLWKTVSQPTYFLPQTQWSGKRVKCCLLLLRPRALEDWKHNLPSWCECWLLNSMPASLSSSVTSFYFIWLHKIYSWHKVKGGQAIKCA